MTHTIHTQPHAHSFEVRSQADVQAVMRYLLDKVVNQTDKMAEVIIQVWKETEVPVKHPDRRREG